VVWIARDVSVRKAAEDRLAHQALHDPLTGLANRQLFMDRLELALARLGRHASQLAILFVDLDRLKHVNDGLGHAAGDEVLVNAARRMRRVLRPTDTLARFGGDEFVALCEDIEGRNGAETIARRLGAVLLKPMSIEGTELVMTASIGIAMTSDPHAAAAGLLRDADAAMYRAKDRGRANFQFHSESSTKLRTLDRLQVENDLRRAVARSELRLFYQPQIRLGDGRTIGAEALLRWEHPDGGLIQPNDFIGVAEDSGLMVPIGYWVLEQVFREAMTWPADLRASINLSPNQLSDPELVQRTIHLLEDTGADPSRFCLEVTETGLFTDAERAGLTLTRLRELGFTVAIDDFGVGFSSLYHLRQLPQVNLLKLDRSFVSELGRNDRDAAIVASVILLTNSLGMDALGEGVETEEQADFLRTMGCDYGQGFLFGAPGPASALLERSAREMAT
jgi:diguanylate cyclase (GGDEF)-like protein